MESRASAVFCGRHIEGWFAVDGGRIKVRSEFGQGHCPLGGLPPEQLATMMLRDQARLASLGAE